MTAVRLTRIANMVTTTATLVLWAGAAPLLCMRIPATARKTLRVMMTRYLDGQRMDREWTENGQTLGTPCASVRGRDVR